MQKKKNPQPKKYQGAERNFSQLPHTWCDWEEHGFNKIATHGEHEKTIEF